LGDATINVQDWINHIEWEETVNEIVMDQFETLLIQWWISGQQGRLLQLLQYATGLKRLPVGGFAKLNPTFKIVFISEANGRNLIPVARTCFNQLELSAYDSIDVLEERLVYALDHGMNFSFH
jgi:E3 ubiquitin-protein ligase NEDD4